MRKITNLRSLSILRKCGSRQGEELEIVHRGNGFPAPISASTEKNLPTILHLLNLRKREPGLGLSLSYDIIKVHGGDLRVKSIEGEGTEMIFFCQLATN